MENFRKVFGNKLFSIIGMIHVNPLPGTPMYHPPLNNVIKKAVEEAKLYLRHNVDAVMLENMHDIPYVQAKHLQPETTANMARICYEVKQVLQPNNVPCGVQILAGGNKEALAVAKACDLNFIRVEGYVFSHIADEGFTDAIGGTLLRYRKNIDADNILVFADIKKKHSSHSITNDVSLVETAKAAEFFLADAVILTGTATGNPADEIELKDLKHNTRLPVLIGSGVTLENFERYLEADAAIVGSYFKKNGDWRNDIDEEKVKYFMKSLNSFRNKVNK